MVRGTITKFLILIIPIYRLFMIDKRRVNLKVQYSVVESSRNIRIQQQTGAKGAKLIVTFRSDRD